MDHRSTRDKDAEVDLESGLVMTEDSKKVSTPDNAAKQGNTLFAQISCWVVGDSILEGANRPSLHCDESNLSGVPMDSVKVTNNPLLRHHSVDCAEKTPVKEKHKKSPKPPRPPRSPSLDAADQKLIREISELAMLKRARIERRKALKKMKVAKKPSSSGSSSSSMLAMVFTVVFCAVIILQGMSSGKSSAVSFQGSPVAAAGGAEASLIEVQFPLNPSSSVPNAPTLEESHNYVQEVTGSYLPVN